MSRLVVFGGGGMGREALDIARVCQPDRKIVIAIDGGGHPINDCEVIDPSEIGIDDEVLIAVGDGKARRMVADRLAGISFARLLSHSARLSPYARLGEGALVADFAVINSGSVVGRHFQANCFAQVSHDCLIGDFVTLAPRVSCNGWVEIADDVFVGAGAVIRNGSSERRLVIGPAAIIGMGAVVTADVPAGARIYAPRSIFKDAG